MRASGVKTCGVTIPPGPPVPSGEPGEIDPPVERDRVLWQLAVDAAGVGAWDWDLTTRELRWDERLLEIFGIAPDDFVGTIEAFGEFVHPDDRAKVTKALDESIRTIGPYAAEYRVIRSDGEVRWVRARGRTLPGEDGRAARLVGAAHDTTAVQEGEARVARILATMPTAFFHLDPDWRFTFVNDAAIRVLSAFGAVVHELVGENVWELFPEILGTPIEERYRTAVATGEPVSFETYYPEPLDSWFEVHAWPGPDGLSVYFYDIDERRRAGDVLERSAERAALLSAVTDALIGTLDLDEAVARLAQVVVPVLGEWAVVTLADVAHGGGNWRRGLRGAGSWHVDPERRPLTARYCKLRLDALSDTSFLDLAFHDGRPQVVNEDGAARQAAMFDPGEVRDLALELGAGAFAAVPLRGRDRTVGLLSVFRDPSHGPFTDEDLDLLGEVAARAGLALDNARLYAEQRDVAEVLQRSMMTAPPEPDQLEVAVRYVSAAEAAQVGGDWYDAFQQEPGVTMVAIGDVVGHDTEAAAAMSQVRSLLRAIAAHTGDGPADVLRGVDRAMERLELDTTATAVVARFEQTEEERAAGVTRVRWSNAGHPPPMIVVTHEDGAAADRAWRLGERPDEAVAALWADRFDLLLGLDPETPRSETVVTLPADATVWLYTDGLVERRGQGLDEGLAKLREVLDDLAQEGLGLEEASDQLLRRMVPERPEDDVALVAVRMRRPEAEGSR